MHNHTYKLSGIIVFLIILSVIILCFSENLEGKEVDIEPIWPMYGHDSQHTCHSLVDTSKNEGKVVWKLHIGKSPVRSPIIANDGTLYCCMENYVYAISSEGKIQWKFEVYGVCSYPAIADDGTLYVSTHKGYIYAINPDGSLKWSVKTNSNLYNPPVIDYSSGTIYIIPYDIYGNDYLYAIYPNGTLKWKVELPPSTTSAVIGLDRIIYVYGRVNVSNWYLYAIYPNGSLKWKTLVSSKRWCICKGISVKDDGTIYVSGDYLYAFYPNGSLKWKYWAGGTTSIAAIGPNDTVYVGFGDILYALYPDGKERWTFKANGDAITSIAVDSNGIVYAVSYNYLYSIYPNGTLRWIFKTNESLDCPVIGNDGKIYVGALKGNLYAIGKAENKLSQSMFYKYFIVSFIIIIAVVAGVWLWRIKVKKK